MYIATDNKYIDLYLLVNFKGKESKTLGKDQ